MKVLVTGGCGFIGSHMVDRLLKDGHEVVVLDNCSTGRLENLEHHKGNKNLRVEVCDIADFSAIESHFKGAERVFHLAALADIVPSIQQPLKYHEANVDGTINVLEAGRRNEVKRFIYAASSSCYGIPEEYPTPETAPMDPQYPYALTKYLGEEYVMHWHKIYELPVTSMRFFNVYGPRSRTSGTYGAVFGVFLAQKLAGKPYTVVGTGEQTRDFTFVTDIVDACVTASEKNQAIGQIYNVGSNNHYSVNRLVELLGGEKTHIPKRPGEPDCTFADTTKIQRELNWKPQVSLEEGVAEMIKNIDYWKQAPVWDSDSIKDATKDWFKYLK
jgi:UDP-glucose 4-epimerase